MVDDSILDSVKVLLGIDVTITEFDTELILFINSSISTLYQLGFEGADGFSITDNTAVWADFIGTDTNVDSVKTYVFLNVKLAFDTPQNSFLVKAIETQIEQLTWRLNVAVDIVEEAV